ncbi:hypothetical protein AHAS_Ahas06G0184600 [Arachis hypogaea]
MSNEKKVIIQELGFDGLMHIPPMNMPHKLLKELTYSFDLIRNTLDTRYGVLSINQENIRVAIGLNASGSLFPGKVNYKELSEGDKEVYRSFQGKTLKQLTESMMKIRVDSDKNHLKFKRMFILYIQMSFLLPKIINKGKSEHKLKKKKSVDGCLYALMIVYFHESKHKNKPVDTIPGPPWLQHWTKELLLETVLGHCQEGTAERKLTRMKEEEKNEENKKTQKKNVTSSESNSGTDFEFDFEQDSREPPKIRK